MITSLTTPSRHYWHLTVWYRCKACPLCVCAQQAKDGMEAWPVERRHCYYQNVTQKERKESKERRRGPEGGRASKWIQKEWGKREWRGGGNTFMFYPSFSPTFAVWLFPLNCSSMAALHAMWGLFLTAVRLSVMLPNQTHDKSFFLYEFERLGHFSFNALYNNASRHEREWKVSCEITAKPPEHQKFFQSRKFNMEYTFLIVGDIFLPSL